MIFLDHRFTIPNFPSRLLNYMAAKLPILACTDPNTDIGKVIVDNGFGWWCESNDIHLFNDIMKAITESDCNQVGMKSFEYLKENYSSGEGYKIIVNF